MNFTTRLFLLGASVSALFLTSCAHVVSYDLGQEDVWNGSHVPGSVKVQEFQDAVPREERINVQIEGELYRVNGREGYSGGRIAPGISRAIAKHLEHSKLFDKVYYPGGNGRDADYTLSGTISEYNSTAKVNRKAENSVVLGAAAANIAGAAVAAGAMRKQTTDASSEVVLSDVRLRSRQGRTVWSQRRMEASSDEKGVHFLEADVPKVFSRPDKNLRSVVKNIISGIGKSRAARRGRRAAQ